MLKFLAKSAVIALIVAFASSPAAMAAEAGKKHHVIFHVTDSDQIKWNQALNNAANLQKAVGKENIEVEVVVNGPGLDMMKFESPVGSRMKEAMNNGVSLLACAATMRAAKITEKDLYQGVKTVPGGVGQIMKRQEAGWTYIKI
jgi:intracellular sulfur oxidation DsrE/DsrF family protein